MGKAAGDLKKGSSTIDKPPAPKGGLRHPPINSAPRQKAVGKAKGGGGRTPTGVRKPLVAEKPTLAEAGIDKNLAYRAVGVVTSEPFVGLSPLPSNGRSKASSSHSRDCRGSEGSHSRTEPRFYRTQRVEGRTGDYEGATRIAHGKVQAGVHLLRKLRGTPIMTAGSPRSGRISQMRRHSKPP
jgi:hypothetical protein